MAWITLDTAFLLHPHIAQLASRLRSKSVAEAIGVVASVWMWAVVYAPDGILPIDIKATLHCVANDEQLDAFIETMVTYAGGVASLRHWRR
jgi:hypothetical protein